MASHESPEEQARAASIYPPVPAVERSFSAFPEPRMKPNFSYTREQKGHSLILNLLLIGPLTIWITTIYYTVSPRHFWHA